MHSVIAEATSNCKLWSKGYPKLGATYRTVGATCPNSCIFHPINKTLSVAEIIARWGESVDLLQVGECYANKGHTGNHSRRAAQLTMTDWGKLSKRKLIRINVSGDILLPDGSLDVDYMLDLCAVARANPETQYWMYTHAWQLLSEGDAQGIAIPSNIEILASVNSDDEYKAAKAWGWRTARATSDVSTLNKREVVCPEQTGKASSCVACGLCPTRKGVKGTRNQFIDLQVAPDIVFILH